MSDYKSRGCKLLLAKHSYAGKRTLADARERVEDSSHCQMTGARARGAEAKVVISRVTCTHLQEGPEKWYR